MDKLNNKLEDINNRFYAAFDYCPHGMALVSEKGRFMEVNRPLLKMLEYTKSELLSLTFQEVTFKDDLKGDLDNAEKVKNGIIKSYSMEKRYIKKSGKVFWINLSVSGVHDENGNFKYFVSQIQDISKQKRIEEDAEVFFNLANLGLAISNGDGIWVKCNEAFCNMLKMKKEDILGSNFRQMTYKEDLPIDEEAIRKFENKDIDHITFKKRYQTGNGNIIWVILTVKSYIDSSTGDISYLCTITDISELKALEEQLESFNFSVAHDFKEPVRSIISYSELLLEEELCEEKSLGFLNRIKIKSYIINDMISNLMGYCEDSSFDLNLENINLNDNLKRVLSEFDILPDKNINIYNCNIEILTVKVGISQILRNLISNAIKYGNNNIDIFTTKQKNGHIWIHVKDDGDGIKGIDKESIFKPFKKGYTQNGSGLGLALVKRICDKLGYFIEVNTGDKGTEFIIKI